MTAGNLTGSAAAAYPAAHRHRELARFEKVLINAVLTRATSDSVGLRLKRHNAPRS
ncbi:hypothetical protein KCP75_15845 [Salmonella enterica subsp. enterica]|nr:hypothetical protein KCP75_15845 [Salmonella enterica subsp. enterica]